MAVQTKPITVVESMSVPAAQVYRALTSQVALKEWLCDQAQVNATAGGLLLLTWNQGYYVHGAFQALEADKRLVLTWQGADDPAPTRVEFLLEPEGKGTRVTVRQNDLEDKKTQDKTAQKFEQDWKQRLETLKCALETGDDLRVLRRPIIGLGGTNQMTKELAAKLGVPVEEGLQITGIIPGLGAEVAGLKVDDVLVALGGKPVPNYQAFTPIITQFSAGDRVEVMFYRGADKKTVTLTLSPYPRPEVPDRDALVARLRQVHTELDAELAKLLKDVTEDEASYHPAPGEWNVKETVAHLIWTERFAQCASFGIVGGDDNVAWPDNGPLHLVVSLAAYPTLVELIAALKREEASNVGVVEALSDEFVATCKRSYKRIGEYLLSLPDHSRQHFAQIDAALKAARSC